MRKQGANEGIYSFLLAFLHEGDEVIMFEPFFDQVSVDTRLVPLHDGAHFCSIVFGEHDL
jgi:histidinol-phosphate/aromatic aminotransferase/cobyric acid decarboxylase-like protein